MIDHMNLRLGQNGWLEIQDKTDGSNKIVDLWMYTSPVIYGFNNLPWAYIINGELSSWSSFTVRMGYSGWQHIATIYVGYAPEFTFRSGETGSALLGHGQDITVPLSAGSNTKTVAIKDEGVLKRAIPFVKDAGVWKPAAAMVMLNSEWKEAT